MLFSAVIIISLCLYAVLAWKKTDTAICVLLVLLPSYCVRFQIFAIPTTYLEMLLIILCFATILRVKKLPELLQSDSPYRIPILILIISGIVGIIVTPEFYKGMGLFRAYIIEPIFFFLIFISAIRTKKQLEKIIWSLGILGAWVGAFAILQFFTNWNLPNAYAEEIPRRMTSVFSYPNALALLLVPLWILYFFLLRKNSIFSQKTMPLRIAFLAIMGVGIFLSFSDGAWVAILASLLLYSLFTKHRLKILSLCAIIAIIAMIIPTSRNYIVNLVMFRDVSGDVRIALWQGTWNMLKANPLFGAGLSGFPETYKLYKLNKHVELLQYPHTTIFNWWSELGLLGLFAFASILAIYFKILAQFIRLKKNIPLYAALLVVMVGINIQGLVDVIYFKNDLAVLFWTIVGLAYVSINKNNQ